MDLETKILIANNYGQEGPKWWWANKKLKYYCIFITSVSMETDFKASISCRIDLGSKLLLTLSLPSMICSVNNVIYPQCIEWWWRLPSLVWLVHVTTTDIERLSAHVNLGREDTAVNLVWLPGNNCSTFTAVFALPSFILFKDGDAWDCERFEFPGCLRRWLTLPQSIVFDEYKVSSDWQLTSPSVRSDTALKW